MTHWMKRMAYGKQTAAWDSIESGEHSAGLPLNLGATNRWRLGPVAMAHMAWVKSDVLLAKDVNLSGRIDGRSRAFWIDGHVQYLLMGESITKYSSGRL